MTPSLGLLRLVAVQSESKIGLLPSVSLILTLGGVGCGGLLLLPLLQQTLAKCLPHLSQMMP